MVRRRICAISLLALVLAVLTGCFRTSQKPKGPSVNLKAVTFDELEQAIDAKKGSVVVVDVWASW